MRLEFRAPRVDGALLLPLLRAARRLVLLWLILGPR
jgi:hypothetical protein